MILQHQDDFRSTVLRFRNTDVRKTPFFNDLTTFSFDSSMFLQHWRPENTVKQRFHDIFVRQFYVFATLMSGKHCKTTISKMRFQEALAFWSVPNMKTREALTFLSVLVIKIRSGRETTSGRHIPTLDDHSVREWGKSTKFDDHSVREWWKSSKWMPDKPLRF